MEEIEVNSIEKYLPIGTIIKLKSGHHKVMITGFCLYDHDQAHTLYDYCGCAYPEGMLSTNEVNLFNHTDIEKIYHIGYTDDDEKKFKVNLGSMLQIIGTTDTADENTPIMDMPDDDVVFGIDN